MDPMKMEEVLRDFCEIIAENVASLWDSGTISVDEFNAYRDNVASTLEEVVHPLMVEVQPLAEEERKAKKEAAEKQARMDAALQKDVSDPNQVDLEEAIEDAIEDADEVPVSGGSALFEDLRNGMSDDESNLLADIMGETTQVVKPAPVAKTAPSSSGQNIVKLHTSAEPLAELLYSKVCEYGLHLSDSDDQIVPITLVQSPAMEYLSIFFARRDEFDGEIQVKSGRYVDFTMSRVGRKGERNRTVFRGEMDEIYNMIWEIIQDLADPEVDSEITLSTYG